MFLKTKKNLICALVLLCAMLFAAVGTAGLTQNVKTAYASATNSETIDLGSDGRTSAKFDVTIGATTTKYSTFEEAWAAANNAGTATVKMNADATVSQTLVVDKNANITLYLHNCMLALNRSAASGSVIKVEGTLTINNTIDGGALTSHKILDPVTNIEKNIYGGVITGGKGTIVGGNKLGGGIFVTDGGSLTIADGKIAGNTADYGGGVRVNDGATFTMNSSAWILYNKAAKDGGGVCVCNANAVEINGDISYNSALAGGGIYFEDGASQYKVSGSSVSDNSATADKNYSDSGKGGGIYLDGCDILLLSSSNDWSLCAIYSNTASKQGGGIYVNEKSELNIGNIEVSNNKSGEKQNNIYLDGDTKINVVAQLSPMGIYVNNTGAVITGFTSDKKPNSVTGPSIIFKADDTANDCVWYSNETTGEVYIGHAGGTATCTQKAVCEHCGEEYGDLAAHDFENGEYIKSVTEHWKECKNCNAQDTDHKESHSGGTATCMVVAVCEKCGFNYGGLGSHSLTHNEAHNATCTENGNTEYWWCVHCEKYFSDSAGNNEIDADNTVINKSGHSFGDWQNEIAATCTTSGTKAHKDCTLCNKHFDVIGNEIADLTIVALGHSEVNHSAQAPTCTQIGWNAYVTCNHCDYTTYEEIAALGHDYATEFTVDEAATCTEKGSKSKHCTRCTEKTEVTEIEKTAHSEVEIPAVAATCTQTGLTAGKKCSVCGTITVAQQMVEMIPHIYGEWETTLEPTCSAVGSKKHSCTVCHHEETAEIAIDANAHSFATTWTSDESGHWHAATCGHSVKQDYAEHSGGTASCTEKATCSECQEKYGNFVPHDFESSTTYKSDGMQHWKQCANCTAEDTDNKVNHTGGTATCTEKATCSVCQAEYGEILGHDWDEGEIITPATCKTKGEKTFTCKRSDCTETKTEEIEIDDTAHSYATDWTNDETGHWHAATCGHSVKKDYAEHSGGTASCTEKAKCSVCQAEYGEILGHDWDEGEITTPATCKTKGEKTFTCKRSDCTETKTEEIEIDDTAHSYATDWTNDETGHWHAATCGHNVKKDYAEHSGGTTSCTEKATCSECQEKYGNFVPHDFESSTTYMSDGTQHWKQCANCTAEDTDNKVNHTGGTASCTEKAKCSVCQAEYGEILGHDWDEGEITTPATCKTKGEKTFTCKRSDCTETKIEEIEIDDTAHSYATTWTSDETGHWHAATCGHNVKKDYAEHSGGTASCTEKAKCSVCQAEYGEILGHDWDEGEITTPATCKIKGEKTFTCKRSDCTETKTEEIEIDDTAHSYATDWTNDETGHWHAATCGHDTEKGSFATHTAGDWITDTEPQVGVAGSKHKECTVCGYNMHTEVIEPLTDTPAPNGGNGLSAGAIAGITIAAIIAVLLAVYIALYFTLYRKGVLKGKAFDMIYVPMNAIFNKKTQE